MIKTKKNSCEMETKIRERKRFFFSLPLGRYVKTLKKLLILLSEEVG